MLCCDGIDLVKGMMLVRVITVLPATNGVLIMTWNLKNLFVMVAIICWCCVLI